MNLRRQIFSKQQGGLAGIGIATADIALSSPSPINTLTAFTLSGAGSTSSLGTITGYAWSVVSSTLVISTPTTVTTALTGTLTNGSTHVFKLVVTDSLGNTANVSTTIEVEIFPDITLVLTDTETDYATGTLDIAGGSINDEVRFTFYLGDSGFDTLNSPDEISFTGGILKDTLNYLNPSSTNLLNTATLGAGGTFSSTYSSSGEHFICLVSIVAVKPSGGVWIFHNDPPNSTTTIRITADFTPS